MTSLFLIFSRVRAMTMAGNLTSSRVSSVITMSRDGGKTHIRQHKSEWWFWMIQSAYRWLDFEDNGKLFTSFSFVKRPHLMNGECKHIVNNTLHVKFNRRLFLIQLLSLSLPLSNFMQYIGELWIQIQTFSTFCFKLWFLCNAAQHCCGCYKKQYIYLKWSFFFYRLR
jgi:hypothetical protein